MNSIFQDGIFTSHGFLSAIFIAYGFYILRELLREIKNDKRFDKKLLYFCVFSLGFGLFNFSIYLYQLIQLFETI